MKKQQIAPTKKTFTNLPMWGAVLTAIILAMPMRGYTHETNAPPGAAANQTPQAQGTNAQAGPVMEQAALDELKRMSAALSGAKSFTCKTRSTTEVPAPKTGQFITLIGNSEVAMLRPNKLKVQVAGEVPNFDFYYDGTNIAAYAPQNKVYSIAKAPGTIDEMFKNLEEKTGIELPAADLLSGDPYTELTKNLTSAFVVDKPTLDGVPCVHLAFVSPGIHWQIWIDAGKSALPQRFAVTYADVPNFPRRMVDLSNWNLHPNLTDKDFVFQAPSDAKQIEFLAPTPTGRQKGR